MPSGLIILSSECDGNADDNEVALLEVGCVRWVVKSVALNLSGR